MTVSPSVKRLCRVVVYTVHCSYTNTKPFQINKSPMMKVYYTNTLHELLSAMLFVSNLQIQ